MKLYIPDLGDEIRLIADWTFALYNEDRNTSLMAFTGDIREIGYYWRKDIIGLPCTIPAGSVLKIDRIYIRKGQDDFNSITFLWKDMAIPGHMVPGEKWDSARLQRVPTMIRIPKKPIRFWAKMADVNNIEVEPR